MSTGPPGEHPEHPEHPEHLEWLALLRRLRAHGVDFALTGSLALWLRLGGGDALGEAPLPDCDLLLTPSRDNLQRWVEFLVEDGWSPRVWGEPLRPPVELEALRGRYYVRATRGPRVLDGTYEHDTRDVAALVAGATDLRGVPVLALELLLALKWERGTPRDIEHVARAENWRRSRGRP